MLSNNQSIRTQYIQLMYKHQNNPAIIFGLLFEFVNYCQFQNLISVRTYQTHWETAVH